MVGKLALLAPQRRQGELHGPSHTASQRVYPRRVGSVVFSPALGLQRLSGLPTGERTNRKFPDSERPMSEPGTLRNCTVCRLPEHTRRCSIPWGGCLLDSEAVMG